MNGLARNGEWSPASSRPPEPPPNAPPPVRILTVGGTRFFGRAFVEEAVHRGHDVPVFHRGGRSRRPARGRTPPRGPDGGARDPRRAIVGRRPGYVRVVPRDVSDRRGQIDNDVGHYTLVSSLSVASRRPPRRCERGHANTPPSLADTEEVTEETYRPLKVASEVEAAASFAGRLLVIRPGYIVGPHDPTDRFT